MSEDGHTHKSRVRLRRHGIAKKVAEPLQPKDMFVIVCYDISDAFPVC